MTETPAQPKNPSLGRGIGYCAGRKGSPQKLPHELEVEADGGRSHPQAMEEQFIGKPRAGSETTSPEEGLIKQKSVY